MSCFQGIMDKIFNCCNPEARELEIVTSDARSNKIPLKENSRNNKELKYSNRIMMIDTANSESNNKINEKDEEIKNLKKKLNIMQNENNQKIKEKETMMIKLQKKIDEFIKEIKEKDFIINKLKNQIVEGTIQKVHESKGLDNIGATCYMNATLQCLSNTKKLRDFFSTKYKSSNGKIMSNEFYKLNLNLWNEKDNKQSYSPYSFKQVLSQENPLFAGIQANDSKDLINFLLERMHQEMNIIKPGKDDNNMTQQDQTNENLMLGLFLDEFSQKFNSPISNLFYGLLETKSQCKGCNIIKFNFQVYSFLEFPLQQVNQYYYNLGKRPLILPNNKNPDVDLYECFEYNKKIDLMTGDNQMWCNICNKLCDSLYSTQLYSAPNYLIINLNRGKGAVYECNVNFPEQLNIINYLSFKNVNTVFDLYAVICHLGPSSMSGHFVAYIRNNSDYKWYLYNDSTVTQCTRNNQYNDGMPYILFYKVLKGGPNSPY